MDDDPVVQRTVAQARQALESLTPTLNPPTFAKYQAEVTAAEQAATTRAQQFITERFTPAHETSQAALKDLCTLRDEALALVAEMEVGRLSARGGIARLNELRNTQRLLARRAADVTRAAEHIEAIEADPVAFADSLLTKFPSMPRPTFSF